MRSWRLAVGEIGDGGGIGVGAIGGDLRRKSKAEFLAVASADPVCFRQNARALQDAGRTDPDQRRVRQLCGLGACSPAGDVVIAVAAGAESGRRGGARRHGDELILEIPAVLPGDLAIGAAPCAKLEAFGRQQADDFVLQGPFQTCRWGSGAGVRGCGKSDDSRGDMQEFPSHTEFPLVAKHEASRDDAVGN